MTHESGDDRPNIPEEFSERVQINISETELDVMELRDALKRRPDVRHVSYANEGNTVTVFIKPGDLHELDETDASIVPSGVLGLLSEHAFTPLEIKYAEDGRFSEDCLSVSFFRGDALYRRLHGIATEDEYWFNLDDR